MIVSSGSGDGGSSARTPSSRLGYLSSLPSCHPFHHVLVLLIFLSPSLPTPRPYHNSLSPFDSPRSRECRRVFLFISFSIFKILTPMPDTSSPAANAGLIFIWLQRRAVSPPQFSLALALCTATGLHHHQTLPLLRSSLSFPLSLPYTLVNPFLSST